MREIKFRAWDEAEKAFDYSDYLGLEAFFHYFADGANQYTGLKDKNGMEIYEGDIVEAEWHDSRNAVNIDIKAVVFEQGAFGTGYRSSLYLYEAIKVIGNIYENPELLQDSV